MKNRKVPISQHLYQCIANELGVGHEMGIYRNDRVVDGFRWSEYSVVFKWSKFALFGYTVKYEGMIPTDPSSFSYWIAVPEEPE